MDTKEYHTHRSAMSRADKQKYMRDSGYSSQRSQGSQGGSKFV